MLLGLTGWQWALQIFGGILIVAGGSVLIGWTAPRWPTHWLARDRGPLRLLPGDSPQRYERLGARWFKSFFPELGATFGGRSKSRLPDLTQPEAIRGYVREARRGELVHWLALLTWLPLPLFQVWGLWLFFLVVTLVANGIAIIILRYNRTRLYGVLDGLGASPDG